MTQIFKPKESQCNSCLSNKRDCQFEFDKMKLIEKKYSEQEAATIHFVECRYYCPEPTVEECCPNCGQAHRPGGVFHDIGRCVSCGDGTDEGDE